MSRSQRVRKATVKATAMRRKLEQEGKLGVIRVVAVVVAVQVVAVHERRWIMCGSY